LTETAEGQRLSESRAGKAHWKLWGPYLSERAWGTVREDYSADGSAWDFLPHEHARTRVYRWNEDVKDGYFHNDFPLFAPSLTLTGKRTLV
jgi:hypothetical protein